MTNNINPRLNKLISPVSPQKYTIDQLVDGILNGERLKLSKAITLIESSLETDRLKADKIIEKILPYTGKSYRIAISGVPGVGKSTFINTFGKFLLNKGYKIAILAIDPSSELSKGSILGDKYRMPDLSGHKNVFIRPSPNSGIPGGVAAKTRETILLCEAAGFNIIIVETVGVGQSETAAASMTDLFLLLMASGTGDQLQGIKRGIMEVADILIFTKYDGINKKRIDYEIKQFENILNLLPQKNSGWKPIVTAVSAIENFGIEKLWKYITDYFSLIKNNGFFIKNRQLQRIKWFYEIIDFLVKDKLKRHLKNELKHIENQIFNNKIYPYKAAYNLLNKILKF